MTLLWSADMETGDLSQWTTGGLGGSYDSGRAIRPPNGVSAEFAHSGRYSMKMTIDTSRGQAGCRQFRHHESTFIVDHDLYYGAWVLIPERYQVRDWWQFFQFKSKASDINEVVWAIEFSNRPGDGPLFARLRWKGLRRGDHTLGPHAGEDLSITHYLQTEADIVPGRWHHFEALYQQSARFDGRIAVWQDGVLLWDFNGVRTLYQGGACNWSVNNYGAGFGAVHPTIYVDDCTVSEERVWTLPEPEPVPEPAPLPTPRWAAELQDIADELALLHDRVVVLTDEMRME